ncbi:glycosyltransferase family 39 protein [Cyanobacteria bacterium FACHB-DQ100]|nr:glycosyltransferase family 39 protein [Cyanobacteria bacterium FACHB-DQ100]
MRREASRAATYGLIAILLMAAILRFYKVDQPFIDATSWRQSDTATIADNFYRGNWNIFYPKISWNGPGDQVVGYEFQTISYLAALLYRIVGQHDWVCRAIAIVFGVWGIFAFYQLLRRVWGQNYAVVGAAVLALLPGAVYVDRSFLPDPVMLSLVITSVWLLVAYLQTEKLHYLLLASLAGIFGFLTKISGLIVGIPMLYAIVTILGQKQNRRLKQLTLIAGAGVVTLIPVIAYYAWALHLFRTQPPYYVAAGEYWVWKYGLSRFLEQNYFLPKLLYQLRWFWTLPVIVLAIVGLFLRPPSHNEYKAPWLFHIWMLAFGFYYAIAAQGLVNNPTNLNLSNPATAALTAHSLIKIAAWIRAKLGTRASLAWMAVVLLLIGGLGQRALHRFALRPFAEQDFKLGLALRQAAQTNELVVTATSTPGDAVTVYYSQRRGWVFPPLYAWSSSLSQLEDEEGIRLLKELAGKGADWFGLVKPEQFASQHPQLMEYLDRNLSRYQASPEFTIYRIGPKKGTSINAPFSSDVRNETN